MKKLLFIAVSVLVLPNVASAQKWSKSDIEIFVESCVGEAQSYFTSEGALQYCNCTMEKIMVLYPDAEYIDQMTDDELNTVAEECIFQIAETTGDDIFLKWTDETKVAFIEGCSEELIGSGIDASVYCPCALEEIMKVYTTPFQAMSMSEDVLFEIASKCMGE